MFQLAFQKLLEILSGKLGVTLIANSFKEKEKDVNYDQKVISLNEYFNEDFLIINAYGNSEGDYSLQKQQKIVFIEIKMAIL